MMPNKLDLKLSLPTDAEINAMFGAVPVLQRHSVADQTVRAGAAVIVKKSRQLAPRSDKTGTTRKWSKSTKAQRTGEKPLWKTIKQVVRKGKNAGAISIVGPEWPDGNKAYFNTSPDGREQVLWGKRTNVTVPAIRNWIVQSFDETKSQQLAAMKKKLTTLMDRIWRRG